MNIGLFISIYIRSEDYIFIFRKMNVSEDILKVFVALVNFIPESIKSISTIIEAQKSRGLNISIKSVLNMSAFQFITIPFILYTLRSIYYTSLNVFLRDIKVSNPKLSFGVNDIFIISFSFTIIIISIYTLNLI